MYLKFFTMEELKKMWVQVDKVYETDDNWKSIFKTITLNSIDIRDIIDETNITFTYNSLDKVTKETLRWNLMQNLQYLLQYSGWQMNMQEVANVLAWLDFDPTKLFKKEKAEVQPTWNNFWEQWWQYQQYWQQQSEYSEQPTWDVNPNDEMSDEDIMAELQNIV